MGYPIRSLLFYSYEKMHLQTPTLVLSSCFQEKKIWEDLLPNKPSLFELKENRRSHSSRDKDILKRAQEFVPDFRIFADPGKKEYQPTAIQAFWVLQVSFLLSPIEKLRLVF